MSNELKKHLKLSARQVEAIEILQKEKKVFASYNCYLNRSTINFLIKHKLAKMNDHYLELTKTFKPHKK